MALLEDVSVRSVCARCVSRRRGDGRNYGDDHSTVGGDDEAPSATARFVVYDYFSSVEGSTYGDGRKLGRATAQGMYRPLLASRRKDDLDPEGSVVYRHPWASGTIDREGERQDSGHYDHCGYCQRPEKRSEASARLPVVSEVGCPLRSLAELEDRARSSHCIVRGQCRSFIATSGIQISDLSEEVSWVVCDAVVELVVFLLDRPYELSGDAQGEFRTLIRRSCQFGYDLAKSLVPDSQHAAGHSEDEAHGGQRSTYSYQGGPERWRPRREVAEVTESETSDQDGAEAGGHRQDPLGGLTDGVGGDLQSARLDGRVQMGIGQLWHLGVLWGEWLA